MTASTTPYAASSRPPVPTVGDRGFLIDAAAIAVVSAAISLVSSALGFMTVLVPAVIAVRTFAWSRLAPGERGGATVRGELVLLALCTALGGFNDWNTVIGHGVYDYTVPCYFPEVSTIPLWMLLFWGLILRFLITLFRWRRLAPTPRASDRIYFGGRWRDSAGAKLAIELVLVAITRQAIYRTATDPVWSWLPFALALLLYLILFPPDRHDRRLLALFAIGGPLIEILYIQVGHLHRYQLGWIGGVPLWIALWWILAALIWKDVSARLQAALAHSRSG